MAVRRGRLGRFLDAGDDVGCVNGLWLLCVLIAVEFEENPIQWSVLSIPHPISAAASAKHTVWPGWRAL